MAEIPHQHTAYLRNFIFGVEDSLVSTVGLLSGVAFVGTDVKTIFTIGMILIFVEAFSMAMGSFLAEQSAEDFRQKSATSVRPSIFAGVIMFFSYFVSGFIPLLPYIIMPIGTAFWISIFLSLGALFMLGMFSARVANLNLFKGGLRTLIVGGVAVVLGVAVGKLIY